MSLSPHIAIMNSRNCAALLSVFGPKSPGGPPPPLPPPNQAAPLNSPPPPGGRLLPPPPTGVSEESPFSDGSRGNSVGAFPLLGRVVDGPGTLKLRPVPSTGPSIVLAREGGHVGGSPQGWNSGCFMNPVVACVRVVAVRSIVSLSWAH